MWKKKGLRLYDISQISERVFVQFLDSIGIALIFEPSVCFYEVSEWCMDLVVFAVCIACPGRKEGEGGGALRPIQRESEKGMYVYRYKGTYFVCLLGNALELIGGLAS